MTSDRFQRPQTAAGAHAVGAHDLPPHPPDVRDEEVAEVLAAEFPIVLRGYDRGAVDAYHQRVSRIVAELQAGRSPQSAIRYALEQVSEETRAILQQAHDTADEITTKSRSQASDRLDTAERESAQMIAAAERDAAEMRSEAERDAADLRAAADRRVREAEDEVAAIWQERERLIEDAREIVARLSEVTEDAAGREPPPPIAATEGDTQSMPHRPVWNDDPDDDGIAPPPAWAGADDDEPEPESAGLPDHDPSLAGSPAPEPALADAPPPALEDAASLNAPAPEPALADAPPPPSETPGPLAFELQEDADLGPLDEPAAPAAVDEAAVPGSDAEELSPPYRPRDAVDDDDDTTAERRH